MWLLQVLFMSALAGVLPIWSAFFGLDSCDIPGSHTFALPGGLEVVRHFDGLSLIDRLSLVHSCPVVTERCALTKGGALYCDGTSYYLGGTLPLAVSGALLGSDAAFAGNVAAQQLVENSVTLPVTFSRLEAVCLAVIGTRFGVECSDFATHGRLQILGTLHGLVPGVLDCDFTLGDPLPGITNIDKLVYMSVADSFRSPFRRRGVKYTLPGGGG
ncbi:hypothetical protein HBH61_043820 [Parastagonospora nodorum]|nr:hypothetical protein HBH61_043820 [Parastagonospora nodorum]KAH5063977.1 hypothetical protein HBH95_216810 [Parastagonospora nodorum]